MELEKTYKLGRNLLHAQIYVYILLPIHQCDSIIEILFLIIFCKKKTGVYSRNQFPIFQIGVHFWISARYGAHRYFYSFGQWRVLTDQQDYLINSTRTCSLNKAIFILFMMWTCIVFSVNLLWAGLSSTLSIWKRKLSQTLALFYRNLLQFVSFFTFTFITNRFLSGWE